ncbi:MAG: DUF3142 domain-containing protein [Proteobacteria bacterium]|nr:DUF3142 domain-containing protein [Pseudomonadota bacterium]
MRNGSVQAMVVLFRTLRMRLWWSIVFRPLCGMLALLAGAACGSKPTAPLDRAAYIWQRQWTSATAASMQSMRSDFDGWRVLAAEATTAGELVAALPSLAALARNGKPVVAVFRLNGNRPPPSVDELTQRIDETVASWRVAGVRLVGIEIDHDCATHRLEAYADLLAKVRPRLSSGLKLSITVLPTWIGASALTAVLANVDASVLQVHAIAAPRTGASAVGLFDAAQARRWIDAYAALTPLPFYVALPAYGVRAGFDEDGRAVAVEGEMPRTIVAAQTHELRAPPRAVAALLRQLEHHRPAQLTGIVWFRLPGEDDRRAWSAATLHAVMAGSELRPDFRARVVPGEGGAVDIVLANRGTLDASLPTAVDVDATACTAADALSGFRAEKTRRGWRFFRESDAILRAQHERHVGWLRCASIEGVAIDENP